MYNGVNFPFTVEQDRTEEGLFTINERFGHERRPSRERTLERPPLPLARGRDGLIQEEESGRGAGRDRAEQEIWADFQLEAHVHGRVGLALLHRLGGQGIGPDQGIEPVAHEAVQALGIAYVVCKKMK